MATPVLPYPDMDFTPLDILTAAEMDQMVANDQYLRDFCAGLADGTNLSDGVIQARKLVPGISNYSTSEQNTGFKWIDNKTIYKKTVDCGSLPNNATKNTSHGISNLSRIILIEGIAFRTADNIFFQLNNSPHPTVGVSSSINVTVNLSNITIVTGSDRSNMTAFVTLYYTKTS